MPRTKNMFLYGMNTNREVYGRDCVWVGSCQPLTLKGAKNKLRSANEERKPNKLLRLYKLIAVDDDGNPIKEDTL